jgi:putative DNA primase/helicase
MRPGAEVRLPPLRFASEAGAMWPELHGAVDRTALWRGLHDALRSQYGTPARAFLEYLAEARATGEAELREAIADARRAFLTRNLPLDAPDQARTVAMRFALVAVAGEIATDMGILPWPEGEATRAAARGFACWLADRGGASSGEDAAAVQAVRTFIERHGESRFGLIEQASDGATVTGGDGRAILNRAGWRIRPRGSEGWRYLILPEAWRLDVCAGLEPTSAARALQRAGYLSGGDGKNLTRKEWVPSEGRQIRTYSITGGILE